MYKLMTKWAFAGTDPNNPEQFNSVRTCNIITITAAIAIACQIPVILFNLGPESITQIVIVVTHFLSFLVIPLANKNGMYRLGRLLLVVIYTSYIGVSSINFQFQTQVHLFFLIGIFVVPFLHFDLVKKEVMGLMFYFVLIYLIWEIFLIKGEVSATNEHMIIASKTDRISFAICCYFVGLFLYTTLKSGWERIKKEQIRSERLLLNILPETIASRLTKQEKPIADHFENVSILFADIEGFTKLSHEINPADLVKILNDLFSRFDTLCQKFHLEKIKTVGDQYMAVAGLPIKNQEHAVMACRCAIRMQEEFILWTREHNLDNSLRIGINSGPVVAGVIGIHKFTYDLWGEAVNLASRMESHGASGRIQVSEATYDLVQGSFLFDYRDAIEVKGMGYQNVYWLNEPYSV